MVYDTRYFTTYYAIDAVISNRHLSSALDTIEGPYLPLVFEAGGLPRPSVCRAKANSRSLKGAFSTLRRRGEALRFNRS